MDPGKKHHSGNNQIILRGAALRKKEWHKTPEISKATLLQDMRTAKTLLDKLCSLAQTRLLGIIAHRQEKKREQTTDNNITPSTGGTQPTT